MPVPTSSLGNLVAKNQPNNLTFIFCHQSMWATCSWAQRLHSDLATWKMPFPVVSLINQSEQSHSYAEAFLSYPQDKTGNSNASSGWGGLLDRTTSRFLQLLSIKLIMATFQLGQGNCNIYFQCAVCHFPLQVNPLQVNLAPLSPFSFCLFSG